MSLDYLSESENNEEAVEILSGALNDIAKIVNTKPNNDKNWKAIKAIIDRANFELDF